MKNHLPFDFYYYRGRVGLYAILKALDIGAGDEVAIQAFTCLAVPEGVIATGATPLYIDIKEDGYTMGVGSLKQRLTKKAKAIVVQHSFGIPADMDEIMSIAADLGIPVIEDCCHTYHSKYKGRLTGAFGVASFYSFEWGKPLVAGLGGGVIVNDDSLRERMLHEYSFFETPSLVKTVKIEIQYFVFSLLYRPSLFWPVRTVFHKLSSMGVAEGNFNEVKMQSEVSDEFKMRMASHLVRRLAGTYKQLDSIVAHSQKVVEQYKESIDSESVIPPDENADHHIVFARYPLRVVEKSRTLYLAREAGVELAEWYATPIHPLAVDQSMVVGYQAGSCPRAEKRASEIVSLPTHRRVTPKYINRAVGFLNNLQMS